MWNRFPPPQSNRALRNNAQYWNRYPQPLMPEVYPYGAPHQWNDPWGGGQVGWQGTWYDRPIMAERPQLPVKQRVPEPKKQSKKSSVRTSQPPKPSKPTFLPPTSVLKQPDLPVPSGCKQSSKPSTATQPQPSTAAFLPPSSILRQPDLPVSSPTHPSSVTQPSTSRPSTPTFLPPSSALKQPDLPVPTQPSTQKCSATSIQPSTSDHPPQTTNSNLNPAVLKLQKPSIASEFEKKANSLKSSATTEGKQERPQQCPTEPHSFQAAEHLHHHSLLTAPQCVRAENTQIRPENSFTTAKQHKTSSESSVTAKWWFETAADLKIRPENSFDATECYKTSPEFSVTAKYSITAK